MENDYIKRLEELKDDMIADLCELIRCQSVAGEPEEGAPFGKGPAEALDVMLGIGRREGFSCRSMDGMCGILDCTSPEAEKNGGMFGILCHLDVVPEGNGWTRRPFEPEVENGILYGRGSLDDKGPTIAAFYALKALTDCGYIPEKKVRMIFGLNEETGEESIHYYRENEKMPDFSIVPDSDFPVVNGEMGIIIFDLVKRLENAAEGGVRLLGIKGGSAPNMVPDRAAAEIDAGEMTGHAMELLGRYASENDGNISIEEKDGRISVTAFGTSAHGAMPWKGVNAVSVLMQALDRVAADSGDIGSAIRFYNDFIGFDLHGEKAGIGLQDDISGKLIFNTGIVKADENEFRLTVNIRIPVTMSADDVYTRLESSLSGTGFEIEPKMYQEALYISADDERIKKMVSIYRKYTGDQETQPLVIGGGTYARQFDNAVAFGAMHPGDPDTMHGADEFVLIDRLMQNAAIYAETIRTFAFK